MKWIYLTVGGVAGTLCRYALSGFVYNITGASFPYGTMIVNLSGCFLIGLLSALSDEKFLLSPEMKILWMAGFCGAFTTFSAFILESADLTQNGGAMRAFLYIIGSVVLGFFVFRLGNSLGRLS